MGRGSYSPPAAVEVPVTVVGVWRRGRRGGPVGGLSRGGSYSGTWMPAAVSLARVSGPMAAQRATS